MSSSDVHTFASQHEYVGFWTRFGAVLIDSLLLIAITYPLLFAVYGKQYWQSEMLLMGVSDFLISYLLPLVATVLFWIYRSATPGKMVFKIKVVDANTGKPLTTKQSVVRYLGYYLSLLPFGLGFLWVGWDPKKQGWHDKIAGTVVIRPKNKGVESVSFPADDAP